MVIPVFSILTAILIVLKLLGYISISWLWVLMPLIASLLLVGLVVLAGLIIAARR